MTELSREKASCTVVDVAPPPTGTATLSGIVRNVISQPPGSLRDVTVEIPGIASYVTASDGYYILENVPAGQHTVIASREYYLDKEIPITLTKDETRELNIHMYQNLRVFHLLRMDFGYKISGFKPTKVYGTLCIPASITGKQNMKAGMELEAYIKTLRSEQMAIEATHWHYAGAFGCKYGVGCVIFDYNVGSYPVHQPHECVSQGPEYYYYIEITPGERIDFLMIDAAQNEILKTSYACDAQYITSIRVPVEMWWEPDEGPFAFKGYHILKWLYDPAVGWKDAMTCLKDPRSSDMWDLSGFLHLKHMRYGTYRYIDGEVVDPGMVL